LRLCDVDQHKNNDKDFSLSWASGTPVLYAKAVAFGSAWEVKDVPKVVLRMVVDVGGRGGTACIRSDSSAYCDTHLAFMGCDDAAPD
jgi:hypothetical protein